MANGKMGTAETGKWIHPDSLPEPGQGGGDQRQQPPGGMRKAMSSSLGQLGFAFIGSAFAEEFNDPNLAIPFQQAGQEYVDQMHDRWFKQEYDNFIAEFGETYSNALTGVKNGVNRKFEMLNNGVYTDSSGITQKIDPTSETSRRMKENMQREVGTEIASLTDNYMRAAGRYKNNPYIGQEIQNIMQSQTNYIGNTFGPMATDEAEALRAATTRERQAGELDTRLPAFAPRSGSEKLTGSSFAEIIRSKGRDDAMNYLISTKAGGEMIDDYMATNEALLVDDMIKAKIIDENADDATVAQAVTGNRRRLKKLAAGHLFEDTKGKDAADSYALTEEGKKYFLPPEKERIVDNLNRTDLANAEEHYAREALEYLRDLIEKGDVTTYEEAIDDVMILLIGDLNDRFGSGANVTKRQIRMKISRYLSDPKKVGRSVPEISHLKGSGKTKKGILDKKMKSLERLTLR